MNEEVERRYYSFTKVTGVLVTIIYLASLLSKKIAPEAPFQTRCALVMSCVDTLFEIHEVVYRRSGSVKTWRR